MIQFDTDGLQPHERFDHWCEVRARALFGVTIELPRERRPAFRGRFSAVAIGGATLAEMEASSYRVSRTKADIARLSGDSLCIGHQIRGPGWMDVGRDRVHDVGEGALTVSYSDLPFAGTPRRSDGFHFRTLKIPLANLDRAARGVRDLAPAPLPGAIKLTRLIAASFDALVREPQAAAADLTMRHLAQLALLARGSVTPGMPESRAALRAGHLHAARDVMVRNLHRPELSPALVADALGISLRQLHLLFEPTGASFARTLMTMRLADARRLLVATAERPVAEIAFACGFDSLATFYRAFRQAFGMTPGDVRYGASDAS